MSMLELEGEEEFIQYWLDLEKKLKAPTGKYKLIVCDKFDYSDATVGIFDSLEEAMEVKAREVGEPNSLIEYLIYDDQGHLIES
jgi:hypothetical protein